MTSASSSGPASSDPSPAFPPPADGLPENEPLTPELLEDEAHRNDFMIRWTVVLLAFLLGFGEISETRALVHVKTGQYLAAHGVLPPRTDVFSYSAEGRPWVNLSWLFDLLLAGVHAVGGPIGLTVLKAAMAGATFWFLVNSGIPGVSTWWGSVAAGLALLTAHWHFASLPESVTLLGVSILFWTMHQGKRESTARRLAILPSLFLVWANTDPRAYVGLLLLVMYAAGETIGAWLGHETLPSAAVRRRLGAMVAASFGATLVNPFGWRVWLEPLSLYRVEYPWLRRLYPARASFAEWQNHAGTDLALWKSFSHVPIAWAAVLIAAATALVLNRRRLDWGHSFVFLACLALTAGAAHEMTATALALAAVAAWNGADWYRASFRQTYSVSTGEIVFSRGGRVVTVLALVGVALLAISGRLPMPGGARIGAGWVPSLGTTIASLREDVEDAFDDRPFNLRPQQGDLLIWLGRKVFVDHRIAVYAGSGEDDLLTVHERVRNALRARNPKDPLAGDRTTWEPTLDRHRVSHVMLPLAGNSPDYRFLTELLVNPDWRVGRIGAASATFYRREPTDPEMKAGLETHFKAHPVNFVTQAFRSEPAKKGTASVVARDWPAATGAYESVLMKRRTNVPAAIREAQHYQVLLEEANLGRLGLAPDVAAAFAHLVIQRANEGLNENPNVAGGYRMLGTAWYILGNLETRIAQSGRGSAPQLRRMMQASLAFHSSLALEPEQPMVHLRLGELCARNGRHDLAVRHLEKARDQFPALENTPEETAGIQQLVDQISRMLEQPFRASENVLAELDRRRGGAAEQSSPVALAQFAAQNGCVLKALEIVEENPVDFESSLPGQVFRARLLMEAGRPWDAAPLLERIEAQMRTEPGFDWRTIAALNSLARGDGAHAIELWNVELDVLRFQQFTALAAASPLSSQPRLWPILQTQQVQTTYDRHAHEAAELRFQTALTRMESGESGQAAAELRGLIADCPESRLRPLVRFYLAQVANEAIDPEPPSNRIPISGDMFATE